MGDDPDPVATSVNDDHPDRGLLLAELGIERPVLYAATPDELGWHDPEWCRRACRPGWRPLYDVGVVHVRDINGDVTGVCRDHCPRCGDGDSYGAAQLGVGCVPAREQWIVYDDLTGAA